MPQLILNWQERRVLRMIGWLVAGLLCYGASIYVGTDGPQAQVVLYKVGHVTTLGWLGYWIARMALGRIDRDGRRPFTDGRTDDGKLLARAVLMAGVIVAGSMGL